MRIRGWVTFNPAFLSSSESVGVVALAREWGTVGAPGRFGRKCIIGMFLPCPDPMRPALALLLASAVLLAGCLYRQPILQGNLLESKNVAQLKVGMSKRQVLALLGSPSVADPFRFNRWDYVASQQRGHRDPEVKVFTVHFDGDAATRWEGDFFPEQDAELAVEMGKFGNLPRDKDEQRGGR